MDSIQQNNLFSTMPVTQRKSQKGFKFIDLFAGIGGFHSAASHFGGECVFVSEWDDKAREVYLENFKNHSPDVFKKDKFLGDITKVDVDDIPTFDFLFAGFPCQPFSKGGYRKGFEDTRGTLFFDIARILDKHNPKFVLLENVSNLLTHDGGKTFEVITKNLRELGYALNTTPIILSPDMFGVPVIRNRLYIPAIKIDEVGAKSFTMDFSKNRKESKNIFEVIDKNKKPDKYYISKHEERVLDMWNEFYKGIDLKIIGFPIWAKYFKVKKVDSNLPLWKKDFINKNINLYNRNKKFIDAWFKKYDNLSWVNDTQTKMEWQAGDSISDIYEGLIQFRPSGIRVRRTNKFSTLVAMNHSQIVGKYKRRLTPDETKRLQSFPKDFKVHSDDKAALKQLGNSVNVDVVKIIVDKMLNGDYEKN